MNNIFKPFVLAALLLVPAGMADAQKLSIGIRIGEPPPERAYRVPPQPGADYEWVEGYQYPEGGHYKWHDGYWTRPPYRGAYWVAPYHVGGRYYAGRWEGARGVVAHNHRWDTAKGRDENRGRR